MMNKRDTVKKNPNYSSIKKSEIMSFVAKWLELEIMPSKISQVQKGK
jgi:hypothetical protein